MANENLEEEDLISLDENSKNEDFLQSLVEKMDVKYEKKSEKKKNKKPMKLEEEPEKEVEKKQEPVLVSNNIEEQTIILDTLEKKEPEKEIIESVVLKTKPDNVFVYSCVIGDCKHEYYSYFVASYTPNNSIEIIEPFQAGIMSETILNKKTVTTKYKKELKESIFLSLERGVNIQTVKYDKWMNLEKERVVDLFEKTVLNEYRKLNREIKVKKVDVDKTINYHNVSYEETPDQVRQRLAGQVGG